MREWNDMKHADVDTSILEITIISGIVALVLGVLYALGRVHMMIPWMEIIKSVTFSWFIVSLPYSIVYTFWKKKNTNRANVSFVTLCVFLFVSVIGAVPFAAISGSILCILGSILFVILFAQWIRETSLRRKACVLFVSVFFSVWLGAKMWSAQYLSPLFFEEVATMAAHPDDLWHMSISHMIQTYGVASVGVDGLVFLPYHVGSHVLFAEIARVLSLPIMDMYTLTYPVIFLPLLLFSLLHFSSFVRHNRTLWPIIFLVVGFIGFLPRVLQNALVLDSIFFFSESYTVGMVFVFLLLPSIIHLVLRMQSEGVSWRKFFYCAVAILAILGIGFVKISFLFLFLGITCYFFLRSGLIKNKRIIFLCAVFFMTSLLLYMKTHLLDHSASLSLLHFYFSVLQTPLRFLWPVFGMGFLWIYVWFRLTTESVTSLQDFRKLLKASKLLDIEMVFFITLLGLLPGNIFNLPGGTDVYFIDVQRWISLALVVAHAEEIVEILRKKQRVLVFGFCAAILFSFNVALPLRDFIQQNVERRKRMQEVYGAFDLRFATKNTEHAALLLHLSELDSLPPSQKKQSALFIPRDNSYWSLSNSCNGAPLIATALSGLTMLDGLPDASCDYSLYAYRLFHHKGALNLSSDLLCSYEPTLFASSIYVAHQSAFEKKYCKKI